MTTRELLLVEIHLLRPHYESLTFDVLAGEFSLFYGVDTATDELRAALRQLANEGIVIEEEGEVRLTQVGRPRAHELLIRFGFSDGTRLAADSQAERSNDEKTQAAGYITLTDQTQREFVASILRKHAEPVLDVGCGDGQLSSVLREMSGRELAGIDSSPEVIKTARSAHPGIAFEVCDMCNIASYSRQFGSAVSFDALYFVKDAGTVLSDLYARICPDGCIVVLYSQYAPPQAEDPDLSAEATPVGRWVATSDCQCDVTDFSACEKDLWATKLGIITALKEQYYADRAASLYWSAYGETRTLAHFSAAGRSARYAYVVTRR